MKKTLLYVGVFAALSSCNCNFDMVTTVGRDGALTRCFICPADSAFLCGNTNGADVLPITITDDWSLSWNTCKDKSRHSWPMTPGEYAECKDTVHILAERTFPSAEEMSRDFQFDAVPVKPASVLEKKFKWFYTDYTFRETFPQPEFRIPVSEYLTPDEAGFWFTGNPIIAGTQSGSVMFESLSDIARKVNSWICANALTETYDYIADHYEEIRDAPLPREIFMNEKGKFIKEESAAADADFNVKDAFAHYFGSAAYAECIDGMEDDPVFGTWWREMNFSFSYSVVMPGKPLPSYGAHISGNVLTYNLNLGMIYAGDYTVTASSRCPNIWACIISAIIVITSGILLVISSGRGRVVRKNPTTDRRASHGR